jgi:transcriptional regulator with XRE-family HTH domain
MQRLLGLSGLTAQQLARAIGCTERTVAGYCRGTIPQLEHQARVQHLIDVIEPLSDTAPGRRRALLDSSNGPSVLHRLIAEIPRGPVIQVTLPVRDLLGA